MDVELELVARERVRVERGGCGDDFGVESGEPGDVRLAEVAEGGYVSAGDDGEEVERG